MTPEEKAKRYDETLEQLKGLIEGTREDKRAILEEDIIDIFYELKESEDERIRKDLIIYLRSILSNKKYGDKYIEDWIAWLKKQGQVKEYTFKSLPRLLEMIEPTERAKAYCQKLIDTLAKEGYAADAKIVGECLKKMSGEKVALATMDDQKINKSDDEKIRKKLITYFRDLKKGWFGGINSDDVIAWLEKQDQVKEDDDSLTIDDKINNKIIEHIIEALQRYMPKNDFLLYEKLEMISWLENQRKQKPYGQREECLDCQFNYAGHCKGYCELKKQDKSTFEQCKQEGDRIVENSDGTHFNLSQLERVAKAETPEESLEVSSEKYNEIVDECIYGDDEKDSTQCEKQEPTNESESKFKDDDWIVNLNDNSIAHIVKVRVDYFASLRYNIEHSNGDISSPMCIFADDAYRLWTIKDAKPGDVLVASDDSLFIFANVKDNSVYYHFALSKDGIKQISDGRHAWETASSCHPATKEQRDQLKKAMTDTGYRWDKDEKRLICLKKENSNDSDLEWSNMETKECHCYSCELYDWKNNNCRNYKLCKNPKNTYKGFYKKSLKKSTKEDRKAIRNKIAHEIAWESTKHYDPALSKKSWCEMAVREAIDRVSGEYSDNYMQGYKDAVKDACEWLNDRYRDYGYLDLEDITTMMQELEKIK